ncbi:hypothetical protein [Brevundimonas sp.]|uniref:hypothetical protein n=1 Tax=Brevundimonas sp. TaxID=1871086 RepID=UPI001D27D1AA|nr:hypothetical protein [Brevundimonas sp.]MBA3999590.1 hypothetical protein [Brevundimonas sp.]
MSQKLRNALTIFSMILIAGGTPIAILVLAMTVMFEQAVTAADLGLAIRIVVSTLLGGGLLRALLSIDARLEARG